MLEQLVRPFETFQVVSTRRIVAKAKKQPAQVATITWGKIGTLPTAVAETPGIDTPSRTSATVGVSTNDEQNIERKNSKKTKKIRVENPDDPTQYIMVEDTQKTMFDFTPKGIAILTYTLDPKTGVTTITSSGPKSGTSSYQFA